MKATAHRKFQACLCPPASLLVLAKPTGAAVVSGPSPHYAPFTPRHTHWLDATWIARAIVDRTRPSSSVRRPAIVHPPGAHRQYRTFGSVHDHDLTLTRYAVLQLRGVESSVQRHATGALDSLHVSHGFLTAVPQRSARHGRSVTIIGVGRLSAPCGRVSLRSSSHALSNDMVHCKPIWDRKIIASGGAHRAQMTNLSQSRTSVQSTRIPDSNLIRMPTRPSGTRHVSSPSGFAHWPARHGRQVFLAARKGRHVPPRAKLTLGSNLQRLASGKTHHDASVSHGLEHERDERGSRSSKRSARVKVLLVEEAASSARGEDVEELGARVGSLDRGDDGHALANLDVSAGPGQRVH